MRYRVVDTNFSSTHDWLFKLVDDEGHVAWVLNAGSYRKHGIKSSVHRGHLDSLGKDSSIDGSSQMLDGRMVIVSIDNWA